MNEPGVGAPGPSKGCGHPLLSFNTIQALGSLGEFVSALAVVISLIYLAQQMSQNTTFNVSPIPPATNVSGICCR